LRGKGGWFRTKVKLSNYGTGAKKRKGKEKKVKELLTRKRIVLMGGGKPEGGEKKTDEKDWGN